MELFCTVRYNNLHAPRPKSESNGSLKTKIISMARLLGAAWGSKSGGGHKSVETFHSSGARAPAQLFSSKVRPVIVAVVVVVPTSCI